MSRKATAQVVSLRAGLKPLVEELYANTSGEWQAEEMAEKLANAMSVIDLNEFAMDIARSLVSTEDNSRAAKVPADDGGQLALDLVEDKFFNDKAIYKLGDGSRIHTVEARLQHGLVHQGKLNEKAAEVAQASQRHNQLLVLSQPYIEQDPSLTLAEAWAAYLKDHPLPE